MERTETAKPKILSVLKTLILSYVITALMLLLLAFLLYKFHLGEQIVNVGVLAVYVLSCFAGGFYIGKKVGSKKFLWGFLAGVLYFMLLLVLSMVMNKSGLSYSQQLVIAFAACAAGGTMGGMIS